MPSEPLSIMPCGIGALRVQEDRLLKPHELERTLEFAARKVGPSGGVLILLDRDDDCPAAKGPQLLQRARTARSNLRISVVLAKREFKGWFLAAAESLSGKKGLMEDLESPTHPEEIRGAKEWLTARKSDDTAHSPTVDQAALTALFDLTQARRADSFDKCHREIRTLPGQAP